MMLKSVKIKANFLQSLGEKSVGLINKKEQAVYFLTRFGIHTVGMKYPIDVLILDSNFKVVRIKEGLMPLRIFFWNLKYSRVLELPAGTIKKLNIGRGTKVDIERISKIK